MYNIGVTAIHTPSHRGSGVSVYPTPGGIRAEKGHNISTGMAAGCSHSTYLERVEPGAQGSPRSGVPALHPERNLEWFLHRLRPRSPLHTSVF